MVCMRKGRLKVYSGLDLNQDKATKPQTVQIVRQGEATPYWFKVNPLKNNVGFTAIIFICTGAATVLHGTKVRPALFLCCETFSRAKPTLQKWACQFRSDIHARKAIWPIHFIFDAASIARRHSRTVRNPVLKYSKLFKDCHHFKLLDSHLCGNDDAWFSDLNLLQNHQI